LGFNPRTSSARVEIKKKQNFLFSVALREFSAKIKQHTPVEIFNQKILDASSTLATSTTSLSN